MVEADESMGDGGGRYRAPALEKGLDILELLAEAPDPLPVAAIVRQLGRSHGELFRMVQVLVARGYIAMAPDGQGYQLSERLLALAMRNADLRGLVELALPEMRALAEQTRQSCHLAVHSGGEMVVVARMESREPFGFSVRIGYRRPLPETASGTVLYAFQPDDVRSAWERWLGALDPAALSGFRARADRVRAAGHDLEPSTVIAGVVDVSAPILRGASAAGALTIPFLKRQDVAGGPEDLVAPLCAAASRISQRLSASDHRL